MLILTVYSWHVSHTNLLNVLAHNEFLCSSVVEEHPPIRLSHGLEMMPSLGSWHVSFVPYSFPDMFYLSLTPFLTCFICALLLSWHVSFVPYSFPDMFHLSLTPFLTCFICALLLTFLTFLTFSFRFWPTRFPLSTLRLQIEGEKTESVTYSMDLDLG